MRTLIRCLLALLLVQTCNFARAQAPAATGEESRLALVIGNSSYKDSPLTNPVNDANAMARTLEGLGFKVILQTNASRGQMRQALRRFGDELQASRGVGLFYFAGHGVQVNTRNYLVPVGTDIQRDYEVEDEAIDAGSVLTLMQAAKARVNIVILDACRNNPYARSFRTSINGLAPMQAPAGTVVAYATAPGEVASDGAGGHGLYTQHLLRNMNIPGLKIEDVFKNVRAGVRQDSSGKQTPWENTSLEGEFYFKINVNITVQATSPGLSRAEVESAMAAALAKRDQDEAARRQAQQLEIERAVQAALRKREEEASAAQASRQNQEAQTARAAVDRLTQELAELRAARMVQSTPAPASQSTAPPAVVADSVNVAAPATPPPQQLALAVPTGRPAPIFTVGQPVDKPEIAVGSHWRYQVTDLYTGIKHIVAMEVQSVTENRIYTQSAPVTDAPSGKGIQGGTVQVWDRNWNLLREGSIDYSSPYPELQFPLVNGKKWASQLNYPYIGGVWRQQNTGQIVGWEKLTVPAGTFDVVKIEIRGYWHLNHVSPNTVGSGAFTEIFYYAPQARQYIKRELLRSGGGSLGNVVSHSSLVRERWELTEFSK